jgi:hypothetical protein
MLWLGKVTPKGPSCVKGLCLGWHSVQVVRPLGAGAGWEVLRSWGMPLRGWWDPSVLQSLPCCQVWDVNFLFCTSAMMCCPWWGCTVWGWNLWSHELNKPFLFILVNCLGNFGAVMGNCLTNTWLSYVSIANFFQTAATDPSVFFQLIFYWTLNHTQLYCPHCLFFFFLFPRAPPSVVSPSSTSCLNGLYSRPGTHLPIIQGIFLSFPSYLHSIFSGFLII